MPSRPGILATRSAASVKARLRSRKIEVRRYSRSAGRARRWPRVRVRDLSLDRVERCMDDSGVWGQAAAVNASC